MRHGVFGRKLNRDVKERKALFRSLVEALIIHGKIHTTVTKAKAVQGLIDKLVTLAKSGSHQSLVQLESFLTHKSTRDKLVKEVIRYKDRHGGYTRIVRIGKRAGDATEEVKIEWTQLVEKEESKPKTKELKKAKKPHKAEKIETKEKKNKTKETKK